jgi:hypothetical protein
MFARRSVLTAVRGFDEDFFLYGEDEDLCLRIRKAGWEIGCMEEAVVVHVGGQSERRTLSPEKWRKKIRAEYLFYTKHYGPETVARIRRADRLKARWRLLTLGLSLPLLREKAVALEKMGRYRFFWRRQDTPDQQPGNEPMTVLVPVAVPGEMHGRRHGAVEVQDPHPLVETRPEPFYKPVVAGGTKPQHRMGTRDEDHRNRCRTGQPGQGVEDEGPSGPGTPPKAGPSGNNPPR